VRRCHLPAPSALGDLEIDHQFELDRLH
jgi:hypothetical protein